MQNLESDPVILLRCILILPNKGCYQYCYCYSIWSNGFSGWRYTPLYSGNLNLIYTLKGVYLTLGGSGFSGVLRIGFVLLTSMVAVRFRL